MCGEKATTKMITHVNGGSPPRVRGKVFEAAPNVIQERITPACAGKSKGQLDFPIYFEDHPRVCGEKSGSLTVARAITGSPPRVRGKVFWDFQTILIPRITPACAGKRPGRYSLNTQ